MIPPTTLDVVIPTFNRKNLLLKTLQSFAEAVVPSEMQVTIVVVDNNSTDDTKLAVLELIPRYPLQLRYVLETRQSSSYARNAGIAASKADLIGFIDDDEEVEPNWFEVTAHEFLNPNVDFIGGPYLPNWVTPIPEWLPSGYHAVIGAIPPKPRSSFNEHFGANLMSGNAVLRRSVFERIGTYSVLLGRGSKGLLSEEDADLLRRIQKAGISGVYVPELAIRHYIAPERLTRGYHRRWVFWRGASQGTLDRQQPDSSLRYLCGVQRYRFGEAVRGLLAAPFLLLRGEKARAFRGELAAWDLTGFIYGKFFLDPKSMYQAARKT